MRLRDASSLTGRILAYGAVCLAMVFAVSCGGGGTSGASSAGIGNSSTAPRINSVYPTLLSPGGPGAFLAVNGDNFNTSTIIYVNGEARTTAFVSKNQVNTNLSESDISFSRKLNLSAGNSTPTNEISLTMALPVQIPGNPQIDFKSLNVVANDIVYDSKNGVIWASISSASSSNPNCIVSINPVTAMITRSYPMTSEPNVLAVSDDGSYLYVGLLSGPPVVSRFAIPAFNLDLQFTVGTSFYMSGKAWDVVAMETVPGNAKSVAILKGRFDKTVSGGGGIGLYDDGVQRANALPESFAPNGQNYGALKWGANSSTLYAVDNQTTGFSFYNLSVDATGIIRQLIYPSTVNGFGFGIKFEVSNGILYSADGSVIDPVVGQRIAMLPASGWIETDPVNGSIYLMNQTDVDASENRMNLSTFKLGDRTQIAHNVINNIFGSPRKVVRWSGNSICFNTLGGRIYFLTGGLTVNGY